VDSEDIIKGYEVGKGQYLELDPEELEAIASRASASSRSMNSHPRRRSTSCT
jgi:non-homologous end joining protein Ku